MVNSEKIWEKIGNIRKNSWILGTYYIEANDDIGVEIDLTYVKKPRKTILEIDNKEYPSSDSRAQTVNVNEGDEVVTCKAEDGKDVFCSLWIGEEPFQDARDYSCSGNVGRNDECSEFEIELEKDKHDGLDLYCQCLPDFVTGQERNDPSIAKIKLKVEEGSGGSRGDRDRNNDRDRDRNDRGRDRLGVR